MYAIQITNDQNLCKHNNFSAVCCYTVLLHVIVILIVVPSLLAAF